MEGLRWERVGVETGQIMSPVVDVDIVVVVGVVEDH